MNALLVDHPLPLADEGLAGGAALRAAYAAQERAVVSIAAALDDYPLRPTSGPAKEGGAAALVRRGGG